MVVAPESLTRLNAEQLRELAGDLIERIAHLDQQHAQQIALHDQAITSKDREIVYRQTKIDQLTHEMAVLKRLASLAAAENSSTPARPVCSMKPSTLTLQPSSRNCKIWRQRPRPKQSPANNPNAQHYPQSCLVCRFTMF